MLKFILTLSCLSELYSCDLSNNVISFGVVLFVFSECSGENVEEEGRGEGEAH